MHTLFITLTIPLLQPATGGIHSLAVSSGGRVFTCGCNDDGALGRTTKKDGDTSTTTKNNIPIYEEYDFHEIEWPLASTSVHIVQIAAGDCHSIALGLDGSIYTWGSYKDKDSKPFYNTGDPNTCFGHTQRTYKSDAVVAVIIVRIFFFITAFLFYCLLYHHSFPTNPNSVTNCIKLILFLLQLYNYIAPASLF